MRSFSSPILTVCWLLVAGKAPAVTASPTFTQDVAPILFQHCAECHRPGEIGPFPLLTYHDAKKRAKLLAQVTDQRLMPPWKPHPEWGAFRDARHLTDQQIAVFQKWLEAGTPEGNAKDLPPLPEFKDGWKLGEPDLVLKMPKPFEIPASGPDIYQCFVLPTGLTQNKIVSAVEFRPGNRRVVHHALFYGEAFGQARRKLGKDRDMGFSVKEGLGGVIPTADLGAWTPGSTPRLLPADVGMPLDKGADFLLQIHYHPSGKPETDQSTVGIYFNNNAKARHVLPVPLVNFRLEIPAGAERHRVTAAFTLPADVKVLAVQPHMHMLGREIQVQAVLPDGRRQRLIRIEDWDFNWQDRYIYQEMIPLPKGSRLECEGVYNNTSSNPFNPHRPPQTVRWGEATTDEMLLSAVYVVPDRTIDYVPMLLRIAAIPGLARQWYFEKPAWRGAGMQSKP